MLPDGTVSTPTSFDRRTASPGEASTSSRHPTRPGQVSRPSPTSRDAPLAAVRLGAPPRLARAQLRRLGRDPDRNRPSGCRSSPPIPSSSSGGDGYWLPAATTGYYRPEDIDLDPIAATDGLRGCARRHRQRPGAHWGGTMCLTDTATTDRRFQEAISPSSSRPSSATRTSVPDNLDFRRRPAICTSSSTRPRPPDAAYTNDQVSACLPDGADPDLLSAGCVRVMKPQGWRGRSPGSSSSPSARAPHPSPAPHPGSPRGRGHVRRGPVTASRSVHRYLSVAPDEPARSRLGRRLLHVRLHGRGLSTAAAVSAVRTSSPVAAPAGSSSSPSMTARTSSPGGRRRDLPWTLSRPPRAMASAFVDARPALVRLPA